MPAASESAGLRAGREWKGLGGRPLPILCCHRIARAKWQHAARTSRSQTSAHERYRIAIRALIVSLCARRIGARPTNVLHPLPAKLRAFAHQRSAMQEALCSPRSSDVTVASRVPWAAVATFFVVACAVSWPLFWVRDLRPAAWAGWAVPGFVKALSPAAGPAAGALVAWALFDQSRPRMVSLVGGRPARALLFWLAPALALALLGVGSDEPHLTGLLWGTVLAAYALGEELGWRGFLHEPLAGLRPQLRYVLVATLWGTWHFTTFVRTTPAATAAAMAPMILLWLGASWGLAEIVTRTRAVLPAAGLHLVFNTLALFPSNVSLPAIAGCAVVWFVLARTWPPVEIGPAGNGKNPGARP